MAHRTTIEIDLALLRRAKRALGIQTTKGTVEEALRRVVDDAGAESAERRESQTSYLARIGELVDLDVLRSDEMWR